MHKWDKQREQRYLANTRDILCEYLSKIFIKEEIKELFLSSGFKPIENIKWKKIDMIDQFYAQIDWSNQNSVERMFPLVAKVLCDLKLKCSTNVPNGKEFRKKFIRFIDGIRKDGADFSQDCEVIWYSDKKAKRFNNINKTKNNLSHIDYLFVTALVEEHQVIRAILSNIAEESQKSTDDILRYNYTTDQKKLIQIAVASAFEKGAVAMGVFISPLLREMKPKKVILFGIAATIRPYECVLGDVPCASQVISLDDIAVKNGLEFRTEGFQTDPSIRRWIGYLQASFERYPLWQNECIKMITKIVKSINNNRRIKIIIPENYCKPHILVGNVAGGPFLLRDADFREHLVSTNNHDENNLVKIKNPANPSLLSTEMESHGFMRAALSEGIPASVLKGISDEGDDTKPELEKKTGGFYRAYACTNAVLALIHSINFKK